MFLCGLFFSLSRYNAGLGINVRVPPGAGPEHACAPEQPLRKVQRLLGRILPDPSPEALAAAGEAAEDERTATSAAAKTLCIPFEQPPLPEGTKCFFTGKPAVNWTLWGRSY